MRTSLVRAVIALSAVVTAATAWAQPQGLERVGPTSAAHGFPTWYQDKTGLALEFCQPQNQAELDGGWCLLLPADTTVPESFPGAFADEHFFWAADSLLAGQGIDAGLVLGLEAAFAGGPPLAGDQLVFARIRIRINSLPAAGTYTIYHPFGTETLDGAQGQRIFWTEDIGIDCRGAFDCALAGRIGPFLLPSDTPGGAELPAIAGPVPGKLYIADPARIGPVTGSPVGQNYFRIVGPPGSGIDVSTNNFTMVGRVFQGTIPGRVAVDRASYSRDVASTGKVDVFASAFPTTPARLPGFAPAAAVLPLLEFFPEPCVVGVNGALSAPPGTPQKMFNEGSRYYGQIKELAPINAAVCVRDNNAVNANGQNVPIYLQAPLEDEVTITKALFNPAGGGVLEVTAVSSDLFAPPTLTALLVGKLGPTGTGAAEVVVPPTKVSVTSSRGGGAERLVQTTSGDVTGSTRPFAGNDSSSTSEDATASLIDVLGNDTVGGAAINSADADVLIVGAPRLGAASVTDDKKISYTPNPDANGADLLSYTVTVAGKTSTPAYVSISITPVNDPPIALGDAASGVAGLGIALNLIANDTDVDGNADVKDAVIESAPAGIAYSVAAGVLTFSAGAGTHVFTYHAVDAAGASSNVATVTVTLSGQNEVLSIVRSDYIVNKRRWRVEGTTDIVGAPDHVVYVMYANGTFADGRPASGYLIGTAIPAAGLWALDFALAGANDPRNPTNTTLFSTLPTQVYVISTLGGTSPPRNIARR